MTAETALDVREGVAAAGSSRRGMVASIPVLGRFILWNRRNHYVAPALLYVIVVTQTPFLMTIWYSLQRWNLQRPNNKAFIGFDNYTAIFRDGRFLDALQTSLKLTVGAVVMSLLVGLAYAVLIHDHFFGRGIVRTLLITPFLIMPVVGALAWKYTVLSPIFGVVNWWIGLFGRPPVDWLGTHPLLSIIAVLVWRWAPFMMLILLAGLQALPDDQREAARLDGAGRWAEFRHIALPHLRPYIQLSVLLGSIFIVNEFDVIYMTTQGGPGTSSTNVPFLIYQNTFYGFDIGRSASMAVLVVVFTIVIVTYLLKFLNRVLDVE